MHPGIETVTDHKRGCGWRKGGGLYLIGEGFQTPCGRLPIPLVICPTCHGGIHRSRGWTWINGTALAADIPCIDPNCGPETCPMAGAPGRVGLIWVGWQFYPTPADFTVEASALGVSRRIGAVPMDFKAGETWVWLAHRKAIPNHDGSFSAGVFSAFRPSRVEYMVGGWETDDEIEAILRRGITPVSVTQVAETAEVAYGR